MRRLVCGMLFATLCVGCQQSDTDTLTRLGGKLTERARSAFAQVQARVDLGWRPTLSEPTLDDRILLRLRYDKEIGELKIEVKSTGGDVQVGGKVGTAAQRRRVVDIVESTRGVERVSSDRLIVDAPAPPDPAPLDPAPLDPLPPPLPMNEG